MAQETSQEQTSQESQEHQEVADDKYVEKLRRENAERRTAADAAEQKAQKAIDRANALSVKRAAEGKLEDWNDLLRYVPEEEILGEDGYVDEKLAVEAVEELAKNKPYLAARKFGGDVGQGARGEQPKKKFEPSAWMRDHAH